MNHQDVTIWTHTGRTFRPFAPRAEDVDIRDIAHSLAHQCRFNGHCARFYSVAEHSIVLSRQVESGEWRVASGRGGERGEWIEERENQKSEIRNHKSSRPTSPAPRPQILALWGLLHDAAEAYLGDVVRPLKSRIWLTQAANSSTGTFETYCTCEDRLLEVIAERFYLLWPMTDDIREADNRMLATERAQLFSETMPPWSDLAGVEPYDVRLECYSPDEAKLKFLERFDELC